MGATLAALRWIEGYGDAGSSWSYLSYLLPLTTIVVTAWALGTLGRVRRAYVDTLVERGERIEREAAQQVELAALDERARIAREMHDVVAHGLTVMVVQADGARYAAGQDPAAAERALEAIAATGRGALADMRRMLGLLRSDDTGTAPAPRLTEIADLVIDVSADLRGLDADVPPAVALTAYRVVQESLSNVRKHAGPDASTHVEVRVDDAVHITVEDDGRGASAPDDGLGHGLRGMGERVAVHDGHLEAGPRPGGGFRVAARIPGMTDAGPIRVFLVDDQQMVRAGFRMLVDSQPDLTVVGEAGDGAEALERLAVTACDVVLMDVRMPRSTASWPPASSRPGPTRPP